MLTIESSSEFTGLLIDFVLGYLPGAIIALIIWLLAKKTAAMPLFRADIISFVLPLIVWLVMYKYNWSLVKAQHDGREELIILGWIWSLCVIGRLVIPRLTHKLRFRLAAIHVGSITLLAAVLLALFYQWNWM